MLGRGDTYQNNPPPFKQLDSDPHFKRVVAYFRPSDFAYMAAGTAAFPGTIYLWEHFDPTCGPAGPRKGGMRHAMKLCTWLGFVGGFLLAYQRSSLRLWGWTENEPELKRAIAEGPLRWNDPSKATLDPHMQGVAHSNSVWTQLKFGAMPWFNLVNHPYHGPHPEEE